MSNKLTDTQLVQEIRQVLEVEQSDSDAVRRVRELVTEPASGVQLTITPGETPARELPFGMVSNVCAVLEAYGLRVNAPELAGYGITEVMVQLGRIAEVIPYDLGGRAGVADQDQG